MRNALFAAARFVLVSGAAFALASLWSPLLLAAPAWLAWLIAPLLGVSPLGQPVIHGPAITYAREPVAIALEDPYILAGIPLHLGLWAAPARRLAAVPWGRALLGVAAIEALAGITLALVAWCVVRNWIATPALEPMELVALVLVAAIRVMPLPLWMLLDPAWRGFLRQPR